MLGSGFSASSLERGVEMGADVIACDGGSTDGGPHALATGQPRFPRKAVKRDTALLLAAATRLGVPLIIGSAGSAGGDVNVDWQVSIIREIAAEQGLHCRLAVIKSEQTRAETKESLRRGRIHPLPPSSPLTEELVDECSHIVAMMGAEPIQEALQAGANVIVAGRSTDSALYAALPLLRGFPPGLAWHAGKILDCGAACVVSRSAPDSMMAVLREDSFDVVPLHEDYVCTPQSVAAQVLYENSDPHFIREPSGTVVTEESEYSPLPPRSVRIRGSSFLPASAYSVKLEGVRSAGWSSIFMGGVRDPYILGELDAWIKRFEEHARHRFADVTSDPDSIRMHVGVYGRDGVMGGLEPTPRFEGHEALVLCDLLSPSQETSHAAAAVAFHALLHNPTPKWSGSISGIASPVVPAVIDRGEVYEFCLNHILLPDSPLSPVRMQYTDL